MKVKKRVLSLLLAFIMVFSMMPLTVSADGVVSPAKGQVFLPGKNIDIKIKTEVFQECDDGKNYVEIDVFAVTPGLNGWVMLEEQIPYTAKGQTITKTFTSQFEGEYYVYYSYMYVINNTKKYINDGDRHMYLLPVNWNPQVHFAAGSTNFKISKSVLKLDKTNLSIISGKNASLKATMDNSDAEITWKSSDTKVATVDSKGKVTAKQAGTAVISASADGQTVNCDVQVLYKDVTSKKDFWYEPTNYLTAKGVVKGYANQTEFRPANKCTRAQMVTFIWRLQGEPKPKSSTCKFSDVKKTDYFYKACIWGNENHIVEGYKDGTFGPQIVCARKHAVTFLWRLAGQPKPTSTKNKFSDVKKTDYFYKATLWASEKKILAGYDDGTFRPNGDCLRRQMVTFLYKFDKYAGSGSGSNGNGSGNKTTEKKVLNIWSFNDEVPSMVDNYMKTHQDVAKQYEVKTKILSNDNGKYQDELDLALSKGGTSAPDIYAAEEAFVLKYTQGAASKYAATYKDLGIDVKSGISKAKIAQYTVDIGTRPSDNNIVGLGFQSTGGAFIYRRSIAKEVFGTDDPAKIANQVGPGWDKFMAAAKKLKDKGYVICSGIDDVWHAVAGGSSKGWINSKGKLVIDPDREAFLDIAKQLVDNGYTNDTRQWSGEWNDDMAGLGPKECFGFLGPAWLINYTMGDNCGSWDGAGDAKKLDTSKGTYGDWAVCTPPVGFFWGGTWVMANKNTSNKDVVADIIKYITLDTSKDGVQYAWANGLLNDTGTKDAVASAVVMGKSDGKCDFLGGQNMFDVFSSASDYATGKNKSEYDDGIGSYWCDQVWQYSHGEKTRDEALTDFKNAIKDDYGISPA
ncbi:MAG: S-layer homology domain-containing protein [Clostridiales bacterium]|nr:S-layer homology domain-containing protein [Clostridiales bacterium]